MEKTNNNEFFKAYNCIYLNNELSSTEQKFMILLIGFDKNKEGKVTIPNSAFVSYGVSISTLNRIKQRFKELNLVDIVYSKKYNGDNNPTEYHLNKKKINEYFNCKIYDIKEQVCDREPEIKSKVVSQFEMFLNSKTIKNKK